MKPNIFLIGPRLGPEDTLTAYWHYVLSVVPGLGQAFLDNVCESSGLAPSKFVGAVDHPIGDQANRPDLLLQCSKHQILFEHKLDSPLGRGQLQRYLGLATQRGAKVALMAANRMNISDDVLRSDAYVPPKETNHPAHYLWQDLHPILATTKHHLADEFLELLELSGLGTFSWAGRGNPFYHLDARDALLSLYDSIKATFTGPGVQCRRSANSLIYQVRTPFPPVHLINIGPLHSVAQSSPTMRGPAMGLWVWVQRARPDRRVLGTGNTRVPGTTIPIVISDHDDASNPLPYAPNVFGERTYLVPLDYVLQPSLETSERRLVKFAQTAVGHLRGEVEALRETPSAALHPMAPTKRAR